MSSHPSPVHSASVDLLALLASGSSPPTTQNQTEPQVNGSPTYPQRLWSSDGQEHSVHDTLRVDSAAEASTSSSLGDCVARPHAGRRKAVPSRKEAKMKPAWGAGAGATQTAAIVGGGGRTDLLGKQFPQSVPRSGTGRLMWRAKARPSPYAQHLSHIGASGSGAAKASAGSAAQLTTDQSMQALLSLGRHEHRHLADCIFERAQHNHIALHSIVHVLCQASTASAVCAALERGVAIREVASVLEVAAAHTQGSTANHDTPQNGNFSSKTEFCAVFVATLRKQAGLAVTAEAVAGPGGDHETQAGSLGAMLATDGTAAGESTVPSDPYVASTPSAGLQDRDDLSSSSSGGSSGTGGGAAASAAPPPPSAALPGLPQLPPSVTRRPPTRSASWAVSTTRGVGGGHSPATAPAPSGHPQPAAQARSAHRTQSHSGLHSVAAESPPLTALEAALALCPPPTSTGAAAAASSAGTDGGGSADHSPPLPQKTGLNTNGKKPQATESPVDSATGGGGLLNDPPLAARELRHDSRDSDESWGGSADGTLPPQPSTSPAQPAQEATPHGEAAAEVAPAAAGCCAWWPWGKKAPPPQEDGGGAATWQGSA